VVKLEDLQAIIILHDLSESMLKKIANITLQFEFKTGDYIFKEDEFARYLYAIIEGKVGLELEKISGSVVMIDTVTRGHALGFSALVNTEQKKYTTYARALTHTKLYAWEAADLERLFHEDYELGFLFMKRIARIAKSRLQVRNVQFLDIYA